MSAHTDRAPHGYVCCVSLCQVEVMHLSATAYKTYFSHSNKSQYAKPVLNMVSSVKKYFSKSKLSMSLCFSLIVSNLRHVVCSISSAFFPEFPAAYTTYVNCVGPECGIAVTSPPQNVPESIPTLRAAPMEAPPPPRAHPYPAPTSPTRARGAPRHETFSLSASTLDSSTPQECRYP